MFRDAAIKTWKHGPRGRISDRHNAGSNRPNSARAGRNSVDSEIGLLPRWPLAQEYPPRRNR